MKKVLCLIMIYVLSFIFMERIETYWLTKKES